MYNYITYIGFVLHRLGQLSTIRFTFILTFNCMRLSKEDRQSGDTFHV
jgi:hypothetical protein